MPKPESLAALLATLANCGVAPTDAQAARLGNLAVADLDMLAGWLHAAQVKLRADDREAARGEGYNDGFAAGLASLPPDPRPVEAVEDVARREAVVLADGAVYVLARLDGVDGAPPVPPERWPPRVESALSIYRDAAVGHVTAWRGGDAPPVFSVAVASAPPVVRE